MKRRSSSRLLVSWFREAASKTRAKQRGDRLIFAVVMPAKIYHASRAAILGSAAGVLAVAPGHSIWVRMALALVVIWIFSYWPWTIALNRDGISKRNYFGVKRKILWSELERLVYREELEDYLVIGRDGGQIWFSPFHVDPARFEEEVLKNSLVKNVEITNTVPDPYSS